MKKLSFLIVFLFILSFFIWSGETISGEKYYLMSVEELKKTEQELMTLPDSYEKYANLGMLYHFISFFTNTGAKNAVDYLEKAQSLQYNYLIETYLGSSYSMLTRDVKEVMGKVKLVLNAFNILDRIYKNHKEEYEVFTTYVSVCLSVPDDIFHKLGNAENAIKVMENNFSNYSKEQQADILYLKGEVLLQRKKKKDAINLWALVIKEYSETNAAVKSKKMTEKIQ